jgi:hypothetical protein
VAAPIWTTTTTPIAANINSSPSLRFIGARQYYDRLRIPSRR